MEKLNRKIGLFFGFALAVSVGLPLGILGIIFGAVNGIVALLVVGIVLTVAGFYGTPLLWVGFGNCRHDRAILIIIENECIYTVSDLAVHTGFPEDDIRNRIKKLILSGALTGFIFRDDLLVPNENKKVTPRPGASKICINCGAAMIRDGDGYRCEYCGNRE